MGILFTPLSSLALLDIPREKMAQASGVTNTIRQLGGSFGVAILATLLTTRVGYHSQMYGQAIQSQSQEYKTVSAKITTHIQHTAGSSRETARKQGQIVLLSSVNKQAYIQGIDDDFLVAAIFTLIGGIPLIMVHGRKKILKT